MTKNNHYALMFETLSELSAEIRSARVDPSPALPKLSEVLNEISPLPSGSIFLGMANDGLPVLLNLLDPFPGPILIVGDEGSGKTNLLRTIANSLGSPSLLNKIKCSVFSDYAGEWSEIQNPNCEEILPIASTEAINSIATISRRANANRESQPLTLLLIEQFDKFLLSGGIRPYLRWLLNRGPACGVWPFATLNSRQATTVTSWLEFFRTRLFGHIEDSHISRSLSGFDKNVFRELVPGAQFATREGESWLPFWIPRAD